MNALLLTLMIDQDRTTAGAADPLALADEQLVALALGDDRYFEAIVERYEKKLHYYIMRFINCSPADAEDIIQDVFVNAYRNLNGFDTSLKFSSWIYRIAHNEAINHLRRITARPAVAMDDERLEALASELNVEHEVGRSMERERIREAIGRLDEKYREAIVLRYLEDKSYEEISDILRKPLGSVSSLITRAKKILVKEVEQRPSPPGGGRDETI